MQFFSIAAEDREHLSRWFRQQLQLCCCCLAVFAFAHCSSGFFAPPISNPSTARLDAKQSDANFGVKSVFGKRDGVDRRRTPVIDAHQPQGWRRTAEGWEHTSSWFKKPQALSELIADQEAREPAWIGQLLAVIRGVSPILYSMAQIALIAMILWLHQDGETEEKISI